MMVIMGIMPRAMQIVWILVVIIITTTIMEIMITGRIVSSVREVTTTMGTVAAWHVIVKGTTTLGCSGVVAAM